MSRISARRALPCPGNAKVSDSRGSAEARGTGCASARASSSVVLATTAVRAPRCLRPSAWVAATSTAERPGCCRRCSLSRAVRSARTSAPFAETGTSTGWADTCGSGGSGASSSTTWALVPPTPRALTPARRGTPAGVRQCRSSVREHQRAALQGEGGVGAVQVPGRYQGAVPQHQHRLDQPGHAGTAVEVPDVRLHRAEGAEAGVAGSLPERARQRLELHRVAERRSGAVRLHVRDGVRPVRPHCAAPAARPRPVPARPAR